GGSRSAGGIGVKDPMAGAAQELSFYNDKADADAERERSLTRNMLGDRLELFKKFFGGGDFNQGRTRETNTSGGEYHDIGGRPTYMPTRSNETVSERGFNPDELLRMILG